MIDNEILAYIFPTLPTKDCTSVAVIISLYVCVVKCGICFVIICSSSFLLLVLRDGLCSMIAAFSGYFQLYFVFVMGIGQNFIVDQWFCKTD